ncbi:hypothetical protein DACRYDRAFT_21016 [Dacryopinax primogenitus]|uniref:Uncharacterized protein n=1 Tax=Dacryopinax primogenitus (strain DJM 731) TaxID=1858805 RepID=M5GFW0_DACPD|nr:uncharacterized protein DACRYDRAFT_21016 [Dacryopinax primogenitus]EJU04488.1 hypothetical protein DACRYDRAFT_21016 [Dacryopinax primogenitus]
MTPLSSGNLAQGNDFVSCSDPLANARADATQTQPVNAIPRAKHGRVSTSPSKRRLLKGSPTKSVPPSRVSAIAKPIQRGASPSVSDGTLPDVDEVIKQGLAKRSHTGERFYVMAGICQRVSH